MMGRATMVWENTSGVGEIIAPTTKDNTNTCLRFPDNNFELMIPNLANTIINNGSSKMKPKGNKNDITKDKYCPNDNIG